YSRCCLNACHPPCNLDAFPTRRSSDLIAEESGSYFDEDTIKRWLNEGERVIVRQTRILQDIAEAPAIKGRAEYPLPRWFWMPRLDRKSTRLNSSHVKISYAVFCLKKKN